jgi:ABC-type transporter MlaC component
MNLAKEAGKEAARGIMQTALKPNKNLLQGRGSKLDMQQIFDMNLDSPRGLEAMDDKIKAFRENVKENYGDLLKEHAGKKFNIRGALSQAVQEMEDQISNFKNADQVEGIKKGIEYWKDYLANTSLNINNGWMPIEDVASLRAGVWGAAKFNQASPAGYAEFAEKFGHKINEQLGNRLPDARKLDALLSKTRPMEQATEDALRRTGNNRYLGLVDAIGLGAAGGGALIQGDVEGAAPGLGLALGARVLRSPGAASLIYRGANALPAVGATSPLQLAGRRIIGGSMRGEEEERRK